jgi:hypothetical protein
MYRHPTVKLLALRPQMFIRCYYNAMYCQWRALLFRDGNHRYSSVYGSSRYPPVLKYFLAGFARFVWVRFSEVCCPFCPPRDDANVGGAELNRKLVRDGWTAVSKHFHGINDWIAHQYRRSSKLLSFVSQ